MKSELNDFVLKYKNTFSFYNKNILHDLINHLQKIINFTFLLETDKKELKPELYLSENYEDLISNKTSEYKQPRLHISLSKRSPVSSDSSNLNKTFAHNNLISGVPKYTEYYEESNGEKYQLALMSFDNELKIVLLTKNIKEQLEIVNILERSFNIYSNLLKENYIIVSGIESIYSEDKKTNDGLTKTIIKFHVRTKETVKINKNYILIGYKIFSGEYETGTGEIENNEWKEYKEDDKYIFFPDLKEDKCQN